MGSGDGTDAHGARLAVELRRGAIALAVLAALRTPSYGYALQQQLVERGFEIDQGTLYPLLRRLDEQGLLDSDWTVDEARPRKYYSLSAEGVRALSELAAHWERLVGVLGDLLAAEGDDTAAPATTIAPRLPSAAGKSGSVERRAKGGRS